VRNRRKAAVVIAQALARAGHQHAPAVAQVDGGEKRPPGVLTTDGHFGLLAAQGPRGAQGRQVAKDSFIQGEQPSAGR
jgi:hypothetical protein